MNILIVAATQMELASLKSKVSQLQILHHVSFLVTDVGMQATTFYLTTHLLQYTYDLIIQVGVAGSFDKNIPIGTVVEVIADTYGDLGTEDNKDYLSVFNMQLMQQDRRLFATSNYLFNTHTYTDLSQVKAISVNNCTGSNETLLTRKKIGAMIETMEGLSLHYVCSQLGLPFLQLRAISNEVGKRDKSLWNIPLALENLNTFVVRFLQQPILPKAIPENLNG
jgi:futalosine hydrolase